MSHGRGSVEVESRPSAAPNDITVRSLSLERMECLEPLERLQRLQCLSRLST